MTANLPEPAPAQPPRPGFFARLLARWLRWYRPIKPAADLKPFIAGQFEALVDQENDGFVNAPGWTTFGQRIEVPPSLEPWVEQTANDYVGLALSGGGIRSATFNLGLLQGLDRLRLLSSVNYLSTVSGGGYIGGFWSAWLRRTLPRTRAAKDQQFPPGATIGNDPGRVEDTPEVRHLREFSRFLSPRVGFFEGAMWHAILAFVGGLIPTLSITLSLVALTLTAWLGLTTYLATPLVVCGAALILTVAVICFFVIEVPWRRSADPEAAARGFRANCWFAALSLVLTGTAFWQCDRLLDGVTGGVRDWAGLTWVTDAGSWAAWRNGMFLGHQGETGVTVYVRAFEPAIAWAAAGMALLFGRLFLPAFGPSKGERWEVRRTIWSNALDRVIMRLVGMAVVWLLAGVLWHLGVIISRVGWARTWTALVAVLSGGLFSVFRNWLTTAFKQTGKEGFFERARPFVPIVLAYFTIALVIVWVASLVAWWLGADPNAAGRTPGQWLLPWLLLVGVVGGGLVLMLALDPADYSLHAFYRDRIARAYLGATNPHAKDRAADNRNADARRKDDLPVKDLPDRPLHLVCCAANDLSGDQVQTLSRGSRSATISKHGISVGGLWTPPGALTLGTALTASAAAFNSVMGSVSKELGPAVTFLMTALNLRLGTWVTHPLERTERRDFLPGLSLLREMFGKTNAGLHRDKTPEARVLHLSDGAHFDNLALYELVRRHCRYIIVSDCGADSEVKFDDLGNVVRRIREDFGVEIELDLKPLRSTPDSPATQHAVVGTVHYDRHFDKGVIVYFKPTLVGDEPPDVLQYHKRNSAFPHESTIDQFYDESQWESYRRLGFHSAQIAFRFAERIENLTTAAIFTGARQEWYPTPPQLRERVLEMTARFAAIEAEIRDARHTELLAELFPEGDALGLPPPPIAAGWTRDVEPVSELTTATLLLKAMQTLEDVWTECDLDTQSKHPLNVGWINAFARWATSPSFRRWWPVLAPCFSPGFQRFLREQFYQSAAADLPPRGEVRRVELAGGALPAGLASEWWTERMIVQPNMAHRVAYEFVMEPPGLGRPLQIGIVLGREAHTRGIPTLRWTSEDFFVPPSLWGGGLGTGLIRELLDDQSVLYERGVDMAEVHVISRDRERSSMYREERISFVEFYRSAGFVTVAKGTHDDIPATLKELLRDTEDLDAWTTMQWYRGEVPEGERDANAVAAP